MYKKRLLILLFLIMGIMVSNIFAVDPNLVTQYTFDNSDATDSSGNGHDCFEVGTVNYVYDADRGSTVLSLDGTTGNYLNAGGGNGWASFAKTLTYCAWIKVDEFTPDRNMQCLIGCSDGAYRLSRYSTTDKMRLWIDPGGRGSVVGTSDVNDNQWHHVCGVVDSDGTDMNVYFYIDGVLETSAAFTGTLNPMITELIIGADGANYPDREWNGMADDIRFYDRALSQQEVLELAEVNTAQDQSPDGQTKLKVAIDLSWTAAYSQSREFNIYYGNNSDNVKNSQPGSLLGDTVLVAGHTSTTLSRIFQSDSTYFWRVDVVDGGTIYEDEKIHTFSTDVANSYNFMPEDDSEGLNPNSTILSWSAGSSQITGYNVYFGTNSTSVQNGTNNTNVSTLQSETVYIPTTLSENTIYFWRIADVGATTFSSAVMTFKTGQAMDPNLVGWWNFEDVTDTVVSDASGNNHTGTLVGNASIIDDDKFGSKVLALDGDGDYVDLGNGDWGNPGDHMTVAAWFKVDAFNASYQTIVSKGNQTYRLGRKGTSDTMQVYMNYTSSKYRATAATSNVNDGKWHHAAATYDGDLIRIFIDGALENTGDNALDTLWQTTANLCIGRNTDKAPDRDWEGLIDEVRLYNRALSAQEIDALFSENADYVVIDDMESYDDVEKPIYDTGGWRDWYYNPEAFGLTYIGVSPEPVMSGEQSLKLVYDNYDYYAYPVAFSETVKLYTTSQDWMANNLKMLTIPVYGQATNGADTLYVVLEDASGNDFMVENDDPNVLITEEWQMWNIPLSEFTGVDLSKIKKIFLGVGTRYQTTTPPVPLSGSVYFDNLIVSPPTCQPDMAKPDGDITNDCVVDFEDIQIMADSWLDRDVIVVPEPVSDSNLESFWNFDSGNATDSSGNGHDCNEVGVINYVYDADRGSTVLSLDGTVGTYLDAGGDNGGWADFKTSMTYCAWFKVDQFTSNMQCLIGNDGSYRLSRNGTTNKMRLWNDSLGGTLGGTSDVNDNQWHHGCGVVDSDGITTTLTLYIDGKVENSTTRTGTLRPLVNPLIIGADGLGDNGLYVNREWNGMADDIRIYSRALSHGEILTLAGKDQGYVIPMKDTPANLLAAGVQGEEIVDYKDFNVIANTWLEEILWP